MPTGRCYAAKRHAVDDDEPSWYTDIYCVYIGNSVRFSIATYRRHCSIKTSRTLAYTYSYTLYVVLRYGRSLVV